LRWGERLREENRGQDGGERNLDQEGDGSDGGREMAEGVGESEIAAELGD
jgi:hypothetical protein